MLRLFIVSGLVLFMASCVSLHTPTNHFTPCFTDRAQFEGEVSASANNVSFNAGLTPLKHFSALAGMQYSTFKSKGENYQNNAEFGIGYSRHIRWVLFGVNTIYGQGSYKWDFSIPTDSAAYTLITSGNYQKGVIQTYVLFTNNTSKPKYVVGLSIKQNFYFDNLKSISDFGKNLTQSKSETLLNKNLEPCLFYRKSFWKVFYLNVQCGTILMASDKTLVKPTQSTFGRIGIGLKLR